MKKQSIEMANRPEDLDKCFEVVSALVQQAGDVSMNIQ